MARRLLFVVLALFHGFLSSGRTENNISSPIIFKEEKQRINSQRFLLPDVDYPSVAVVSDPPASSKSWGRTLRFGMENLAPFSYNKCDKYWYAQCRDAIISRTLAAHLHSPTCVELASIKYPNGTNWEGLYDLYLGKVDVYGSSIYRNAHAKDCQFLYPHAQGNMCILVRKKPPLKRSLYQSFSTTTWIILMCTLLMSSEVLRLIDKESAALKAIRAFITGQFNDKMNRPIRNIIYYQLSAFGLVLLSAFSGCFTSYLTVPQEGRQLQTLEEVASSVKRVYATPSVGWYFQNVDEKDVVRKLLQKGVIPPPILNVITDIVNSGEAALLSSTSDLDFHRLFPQMIDENGRSLSHIVPQCVLSPAYVAFPVRNGFGHIDELNVLMQGLVEGGIVDLLYRHSWYFLRNYFGLARLPDVEPATEPRALRISTLFEPIVVLLVGAIISFIAFTFELMKDRNKSLQSPENKNKN